jgi:hypothetical protein
MTTEAFVGNIFLYRQAPGSPPYAKVCQVFGLSGLGQTNALVDATTFCSAGNREYIAGLADGQEITVEANWESNTAALEAMIQDVKDKLTLNYYIQDESESPYVRFSFAGVALSWVLNPSVDDRNTITFGIKISGDITIT